MLRGCPRASQEYTHHLFCRTDSQRAGIEGEIVLRRVLAAVVNGTLLRDRWRKLLAASRAYIMLCLCSTALFVLMGLVGMLQHSWTQQAAHSIQGFASGITGHFFERLLHLELPGASPDERNLPLPAGKMTSILLRLTTGLDVTDPASLLAKELPGASSNEAVLLRPPANGALDAPIDREPLFPHNNEQAAAASDPPSSDQPEAVEPKPAATPPSPSASPTTEPTTALDKQKIAFIYHSHNRESFYPELKKGAKDPNSAESNITLVGKRMADQLETHGLGSVHSDRDYATTIKSYNWNNSYKYSMQTVKEVLAEHTSLQFMIDIHRDSQRRAKTTVTINKQDYAQVYFIVGHRNPNWRENEKLANELHERLEKQYPGLSRGVWGKTAADGNAEYNQSLSSGSMLLEIGGVDNTLEECYRTADIIARVLADYYWEQQEAVKVDAIK